MQKICPICSRTFLPKRRTQIYCDIPCRKKMERRLVTQRARGTEQIAGRQVNVFWNQTAEQLAAHAHGLVAGITIGPLLFTGAVPADWPKPPTIGWAWEPLPEPGYWVMRFEEDLDGWRNNPTAQIIK